MYNKIDLVFCYILERFSCLKALSYIAFLINSERKEVINLYASREDADFHHCVRTGRTNGAGLHDTSANTLTLISGN